MNIIGYCALFLTLFICVNGYPHGAPLNGFGCNGHPQHHKKGKHDILRPQYTVSPYGVSTNTTSVSGGDIVEGRSFFKFSKKPTGYDKEMRLTFGYL